MVYPGEDCSKSTKKKTCVHGLVKVMIRRPKMSCVGNCEQRGPKCRRFIDLSVVPLCDVVTTLYQFLEERATGTSSTLVPPPSLQRFIGPEGFAAFVGDTIRKRPHY